MHSCLKNRKLIQFISGLSDVKPFLTSDFEFKCNVNHNAPAKFKYQNTSLFHTSQYRATRSFESVCWKCGESVLAYKILCQNCSSIQKPPAKVNYYSLFSLAEHFNVDLVQLAKKFKNVQSLTHPDKFAGKSIEEASIAEGYSSLLNEAYATLRSPWSRGVYLLKCQGVQFEEDTTIDNPELLLSVMEKNEDVANSNNLENLLELNQVNENDINDVIISLSSNFQTNDLSGAKLNLVKLKYFTNIRNKIKEKQLMFGFNE